METARQAINGSAKMGPGMFAAKTKKSGEGAGVGARIACALASALPPPSLINSRRRVRICRRWLASMRMSPRPPHPARWIISHV
jgi:hypothetical protein